LIASLASCDNFAARSDSTAFVIRLVHAGERHTDTRTREVHRRQPDEQRERRDNLEVDERLTPMRPT